ncbi:MAG: hypothetical protein P8X42_00565 [Calditrichaceae bacterium]|jgi:uncharacterized protein YjfI (DUF2170 family)
MSSVLIATRKNVELLNFLRMNNYLVEELENSIYKVTRDEELPVFISINNSIMYFEVDLGNVSSFADKDFYFKLLDMNTDILPVSFAINNTNPDDARLVLVESRDIDDLSDQELLSVFDALELATDRAESLLENFVK